MFNQQSVFLHGQYLPKQKMIGKKLIHNSSSGPVTKIITETTSATDFRIIKRNPKTVTVQYKTQWQLDYDPSEFAIGTIKYEDIPQIW